MVHCIYIYGTGQKKRIKKYDHEPAKVYQCTVALSLRRPFRFGFQRCPRHCADTLNAQNSTPPFQLIHRLRRAPPSGHSSAPGQCRGARQRAPTSSLVWARQLGRQPPQVGLKQHDQAVGRWRCSQHQPAPCHTAPYKWTTLVAGASQGMPHAMGLNLSHETPCGKKGLQPT